MRNAVINTLHQMAAEHPDIFLITGDLGFGVLTRFWESYPDRFLNAGICEQNMTSVAAGMALEGKKVFTYSIGNFPTLRCLEQVRNDCAYHNANVKIVVVGGGFAYGSLGMSHHATEDIAIMRALPDVTVMAPGDLAEAECAVKAIYEREGTCYLRLGKGGEKKIHQQLLDFQIGKAIKISDGEDLAIFSTGAILDEAVLTVEKLKGLGIRASLYSFPTVKPLDKETIERVARNTPLIVTIEEHNIVGGFGGSVAEVLSEMEGKRGTLKRIGLNDIYSSIVGSQIFLREQYGMQSDKIIEVVKEKLRNKRR